MRKPLFAQGWYSTPPVHELRQEVGNIYRYLPGPGEPGSVELGAGEDWTPEVGGYTWMSSALITPQMVSEGVTVSAGATAATGMFYTDGSSYVLHNQSGSAVTLYHMKI